jgi:hypothetical protein
MAKDVQFVVSAAGAEHQKPYHGFSINDLSLALPTRYLEQPSLISKPLSNEWRAWFDEQRKLSSVCGALATLDMLTYRLNTPKQFVRLWPGIVHICSRSKREAAATKRAPTMPRNFVWPNNIDLLRELADEGVAMFLMAGLQNTVVPSPPVRYSEKIASKYIKQLEATDD